MKVKCKIWYPVWTTSKDEIEVDVPDNEDTENYLDNHFYEIACKEGCDLPESDLYNAFVLGYAGIDLRKDKP